LINTSNQTAVQIIKSPVKRRKKKIKRKRTKSQRSAPRILMTTDPHRRGGAEEERGLAQGAYQEAGPQRGAREPDQGRGQEAEVGRAGGKTR